MLLRLLSFLFLLAFVSCDSPKPAAPVTDSLPLVHRDTISARPDSVIAVKHIPGKLEQELIDSGLVDIQSIDSSIRVDLKYSTTDNFLHLDVYGDLDRCYLQPDVAQKLAKAQAALRSKYPYYHLVVFDGVRPLHIQQKMWDTLVLPPGEKQKYLSNPANGSLHNYGAAVDIGIINDNGIMLDMGTPFDFFGEEAQPQKEAYFLENGKLSRTQIANREILRKVMRDAGFFNIQTEWWHFNVCRREQAAQMYKMMR